MRRLALPIAGALAGVALAVLAPAASAALPAPPPHLEAAGGSDWQADNEFVLAWERPPPVIPPVTAVVYRVSDADGEVVPAPGPVNRRPEDTRSIDGIHLPAPGIYWAEVWLENAAGPGPAATIELRFDDGRPSPVEPLSPLGWIRAGTEVPLRIEHPQAPLPSSGIRGYAVVVDHGSGAQPCDGADRCSVEETDLRHGIRDDMAMLGPLSEGINSARVLAVSNSGMRSPAVGSLELRVDGGDPRVILEGAPRGWSPGPVVLAARAADDLSGMEPAGPGGPLTALALDGAPPQVELGATATVTVHGDGVHHAIASARDAAGNFSEAGPGSAASADVRIDGTPPRVSFASDSSASEPELIEATVADGLSGPSGERGLISVRASGSHQQYRALATTVSRGRLSARWDSDSFPPGSYEFRVTGFDAAGNRASSGQRGDGRPMVLSNPVKTTTALAFGFGGRRSLWSHCQRPAGGHRHCHHRTIAPLQRRPSSRRVPFGRAIPVTGRLTSGAGAPLAGQTVEVVESFPAGAAGATRTTTVQTGADGFLFAHLAAGPSRQVELRFPGSPLLNRASGRSLRLEVSAAISLHASRALATVGGAPVVFSGKVGVADASIPAGGRPVDLEFRLAGHPWTEFRSVQTDAKGSFRYAYAFSDDDSRGVRFQFRAVSPAQPDWPYAPGASLPVLVTGR